MPDFLAEAPMLDEAIPPRQLDRTSSWRPGTCAPESPVSRIGGGRAFLAPSVGNVRVATVLGLHELNAVLVITVNLLAFGWGGIFLWRKRYPGRLYAHALALGQSLLIAQVALGLLLLSDGRRAPDKLHYAYGTLALLAALSPWLYAPPVPARRLAWFVGATLLATALSIRAFTTA